MDTGDEPVTSATKHGLVEQGSDREAIMIDEVPRTAVLGTVVPH